MTATIEADPIPRDRWGRPTIIPPEGGKLEAYVRASTAAKAIDDLNGLIGWAGRQVLRGLVSRPDLFEYARTVGDNDAEIRTISESAKEAAGSKVAASTGTVLHWWTDQLDSGKVDMSEVPADFVTMLAAYREAISGLEVIESELFVVCDELRFAGTLDRLFRLPDGRVVVGDLKTGKWAASYGAMSVAVQTAIYAHGKRYDPVTGERTPLHDDLDPDTTLLVHMPLEGGNVDLFTLDGELGYYGAELARRVINIRKSRPISTYIP